MGVGPPSTPTPQTPTNRGDWAGRLVWDHTINNCPAVTYSPTTSRLQYHRRCASCLPRSGWYRAPRPRHNHRNPNPNTTPPQDEDCGRETDRVTTQTTPPDNGEPGGLV